MADESLDVEDRATVLSPPRSISVYETGLGLGLSLLSSSSMSDNIS